VDLLLLETFFALDEINAAIDGVQSVSQLPLIASFSYDQGTRTMMGTRPSQFVQAIAPRGVAALGANCGKAPEAMLEIVKEMKAEMLRGWIRGAHHMVYTERSECAQHDIPIWCKPNAGLPRMVGDREVYDATPEVMGEFAKKYVETGAQVVGGCCGNTPAHVAAIARAVKNK
jgi:5-methyltetrahydrofolate--homocysteine methyltransferase